MITHLSGETEGFVPFFNGVLDKDGIFLLQEEGDYENENYEEQKRYIRERIKSET